MTIRACAQCGRKMHTAARGLCDRCYQGLRRVGKLDRYPLVGQRPRTTRRAPRRYTDWHQVADDRKREIDALRARIAELEAEHV